MHHARDQDIFFVSAEQINRTSDLTDEPQIQVLHLDKFVSLVIRDLLTVFHLLRQLLAHALQFCSFFGSEKRQDYMKSAFIERLEI